MPRHIALIAAQALAFATMYYVIAAAGAQLAPTWMSSVDRLRLGAVPAGALLAFHAASFFVRARRVRQQPSATLVQAVQVVTVRGALVLAAGCGAFLLSRATGWAELTVFAIVALGAVIGAATRSLSVAAFDPLSTQIERLQRRMVPAVATVGDDVNDTFELTNTRVPHGFLLKLRGPAPSGLDGETRLVLDATNDGTTLRATARVRNLRRGVFHAGAVQARLEDVLGLTSVPLAHGPTASVKVLPRPLPVDRVPPSWLDVREPDEEVEPSQRPTEDWLALRPFAPGDAWRRVHWPSSMRRGELITRIPEGVPKEHRIVRLILDTHIRADLVALADDLVPALDVAVDAWLAIGQQLSDGGCDVEMVAALSAGTRGSGEAQRGGPHIERARWRRAPERVLYDMAARALFQTDIPAAQLAAGSGDAIVVMTQLGQCGGVDGPLVIVDWHSVAAWSRASAGLVAVRPWLRAARPGWQRAFLLPHAAGDDGNHVFAQWRDWRSARARSAAHARAANALFYQTTLVRGGQGCAKVVPCGGRLALVDVAGPRVPRKYFARGLDGRERVA